MEAEVNSDADLVRNSDAGGEKGGGGLEDRLSNNNSYNYNNNNSCRWRPRLIRTPILSETVTLAVITAVEASTIVAPSKTTATATTSTSVEVDVDLKGRRSC